MNIRSEVECSSKTSRKEEDSKQDVVMAYLCLIGLIMFNIVNYYNDNIILLVISEKQRKIVGYAYDLQYKEKNVVFSVNRWQYSLLCDKK